MKGRIAWEIAKRNIINNMHLRDFANPDPEIKKEIGNTAQQTGFSKQELLEFYKEMGEEILKETHDKLQNVSFKE